MDKTRGKTLLGVVAGVASCELVGGIGALASASGIRDWYPTLRKPGFTPPGWLFGPIWTVLYAMMGVAAFLVSRQRTEDANARRGLRLFGLQLALNGLWSPAFFGLRSPALGLADITALWVALVATIASFARVSRAAALLMLPYLAWSTFAAVLNGALWRLNR